MAGVRATYKRWPWHYFPKRSALVMLRIMSLFKGTGNYLERQIRGGGGAFHNSYRPSRLNRGFSSHQQKKSFLKTPDDMIRYK